MLIQVGNKLFIWYPVIEAIIQVNINKYYK
jgi:hypothetical protein